MNKHFNLTADYPAHRLEKGKECPIRIIARFHPDHSEERYFFGFVQLKGCGSMELPNGTRLKNCHTYRFDKLCGMQEEEKGGKGITLTYRHHSDTPARIRIILLDEKNRQSAVQIVSLPEKKPKKVRDVSVLPR